MTAILGIDQSLTACGWVVFGITSDSSGYGPLAMGCVQTEKDPRMAHLYAADQDGARLDAIGQELVRRAFGCRLIVCEAPAGAQGFNAAKALGLAYGLVRGVGCGLGIQVVTVQAHEPRKLLCGDRGASKLDVELALERLYPHARALLGPKPTKPVREAAFDALAVAHTAAVGTVGRLIGAGT